MSLTGIIKKYFFEIVVEYKRIFSTCESTAGVFEIWQTGVCMTIDDCIKLLRGYFVFKFTKLLSKMNTEWL